jgi:hypothetical protein
VIVKARDDVRTAAEHCLQCLGAALKILQFDVEALFLVEPSSCASVVGR